MGTLGYLDRVWNAVIREPIGLLGLVIAVLAVIPSYLSILSNTNFTFSFDCSEIDANSAAFIVEEAGNHDFVAVRSRCDFSNLDDQTISLKEIAATASFEGSTDFTIEFPAVSQNSIGSTRLYTLDHSVAHAVPAGETVLFDEFYMIPVIKSWQNEDEACVKLSGSKIAKFEEVANCIPDLRRECLTHYLDGMNFWGGAGSESPYRALAIRLKLADGSFARAPLRLVWYWSPSQDKSQNYEFCPSPDKTLSE